MLSSVLSVMRRLDSVCGILGMVMPEMVWLVALKVVEDVTSEAG